jgi:hypothetical protein
MSAFFMFYFRLLELTKEHINNTTESVPAILINIP